jgi:hypothetical protein
MAKPIVRPFPISLANWDQPDPAAPKPKPVDQKALEAKVDRERGAVSKLGGRAVGSLAKREGR